MSVFSAAHDLILIAVCNIYLGMRLEIAPYILNSVAGKSAFRAHENKDLLSCSFRIRLSPHLGVGNDLRNKLKSPGDFVSTPSCDIDGMLLLPVLPDVIGVLTFLDLALVASFSVVDKNVLCYFFKHLLLPCLWASPYLERIFLLIFLRSSPLSCSFSSSPARSESSRVTAVSLGIRVVIIVTLR